MRQLLELGFYYDGRLPTGSISPFDDDVNVVAICPTMFGTSAMSADGQEAHVTEVAVTEEEVNAFMTRHT